MGTSAPELNSKTVRSGGRVGRIQADLAGPMAARVGWKDAERRNYGWRAAGPAPDVAAGGAGTGDWLDARWISALSSKALT